MTYDSYFETNDRDNDARRAEEDPIIEITKNDIRTDHHDFDVIVLARGFDAMTEALPPIEIRDRGGKRLARVCEQTPAGVSGSRCPGSRTSTM